VRIGGRIEHARTVEGLQAHADPLVTGFRLGEVNIQPQLAAGERWNGQSGRLIELRKGIPRNLTQRSGHAHRAVGRYQDTVRGPLDLDTHQQLMIGHVEQVQRDGLMFTRNHHVSDRKRAEGPGRQLFVHLAVLPQSSFESQQAGAGSQCEGLPRQFGDPECPSGLGG